MIDELSRLLAVNGFLPHGYCLSWSPPLILIYVVSDVLIFLAYFSMPVALVYFARRRADFPYRWLLWMFAAFIMACGATHLMGAVVLWQPLYGLDALFKAITALVSITTAAMIWPLIPHALKLPSPAQLTNANEELQREIVVRKRAEEALRVAKEAAEDSLQNERVLMAAIVESSEDAILGETLDGIVTSWNLAAERMFGYREDEILGRPILDLLPAERRAEQDEVLAVIRCGESIKQLETERICKDGRRIAVSVTVSPIRDKEGRIVGASKIARDITDRQRSGAELRIAAVAFESQEPMIVTDANTVILRVNRAFTETTGFTAEDAVGKTPRLLKSGRHDTAFYRDMWQAINRVGFWQGEIWDRHKNDEVYPKWLTISAVKDGDGSVTHYIGTHFDITERKQAEDRIKELAFYDQLTGLPNRTLLLDRLKQAMTVGTRSGTYGALLFIDLDNFKMLNDTLGHDKGDQLLQQVARRLTMCVREGDTVARLGGDEFVLILSALSPSESDTASGTETVALKILETLNQSYQLGEAVYRSTASIGATLFKGQSIAVDKLMKQADLSMYKAKAAGRNAVRFFDPAMEAAVMKRVALEEDLRRALDEKQFLLHYQAQVAGEREVTGAEVLVRWQHPQRGMVSPAEFIPLAEETGLILPLGQWVMEAACIQLALWAQRQEMAHLTIAVNVSAHQFRQSDFVEQVLAVLKNTGANPYRLKLELTESLLVENVQDIIEQMFALKAKGVGFSLDDFGTGYSSLSYLKRLPLDQLKIDQSFVRDLLKDPNDAAIAKTIVALAQSLSLGVIAEGVETEAQRDVLASSGCHNYQGYFFSRPLPLTEFDEFLRANRR